MRGSLHCAVHDETVNRFGRDDDRLEVGEDNDCLRVGLWQSYGLGGFETLRAERTAAASSARTTLVSSQSMQASVMDWP